MSNDKGRRKKWLIALAAVVLVVFAGYLALKIFGGRINKDLMSGKMYHETIATVARKEAVKFDQQNHSYLNERGDRIEVPPGVVQYRVFFYFDEFKGYEEPVSSRLMQAERKRISEGRPRFTWGNYDDRSLYDTVEVGDKLMVTYKAYRDEVIDVPSVRKFSSPPIVLQPTKENHGKRCEARYYFGVRGKDIDEGYNPYCYKLQLRLMKAAGEGNIAEIRETLKLGAHSKLPVDDSFPPLHTAAASGQVDAVRLLLDNGAEVNHVTGFENTPLNAAALYGHLGVVQALLDRGADVCYGSKGNTAGDIARATGHGEIADLLKTLEVTKCK